jgi:hypothetical protein
MPFEAEISVVISLIEIAGDEATHRQTVQEMPWRYYLIRMFL